MKTTPRTLKLTLSWIGTGFYGYQRQPHGNTIEQAFRDAWHILTKETDIHLHGCSRLDSGVHAYEYILSLKTNTTLPCQRILRGLNGLLTEQCTNHGGKICVYRVEDAEEGFHARFLARGKHYRYQLWHGFAEHALITPQCWHVRASGRGASQSIQEGLQNLGNILKAFQGTHNFAAFRASDCGAKNTVCSILKISAHQNERFPEHTIVDIVGNRFLKNMIRYMMGAAVQVSVGKRPPDTLTQSLALGTQSPYGAPLRAPGHGLSLMKVFFTEQDLSQQCLEGRA